MLFNYYPKYKTSCLFTHHVNSSLLWQPPEGPSHCLVKVLMKSNVLCTYPQSGVSILQMCKCKWCQTHNTMQVNKNNFVHCSFDVILTCFVTEHALFVEISMWTETHNMTFFLLAHSFLSTLKKGFNSTNYIVLE